MHSIIATTGVVFLTVLSSVYPTTTDAHSVEMCQCTSNGVTTFYSGTYHTASQGLAGGIIVDGVRHDNTHYIANSDFNSDFRNFLTCSLCSNYPSPQNIQRYQVATVTGLASGTHTVTTTCDTAIECPWPGCWPQTIEVDATNMGSCNIQAGLPTVSPTDQTPAPLAVTAEPSVSPSSDPSASPTESPSKSPTCAPDCTALLCGVDISDSDSSSSKGSSSKGSKGSKDSKSSSGKRRLGSSSEEVNPFDEINCSANHVLVDPFQCSDPACGHEMCRECGSHGDCVSSCKALLKNSEKLRKCKAFGGNWCERQCKAVDSNFKCFSDCSEEHLPACPH